ncbi:MAG: pitrilysin family protein [Deltaproteobacteria bacterium]|nr:pitrilysin family protein [Deltaproteobacteria bacterium]
MKKRRSRNLFLRILIMAFLGAWMSMVCFTLPVANVYAAHRKTPSFTLPAYETIKLKNGMTVYLMEHHSVPLIYISAVFPTGALRDGGKPGLAYLTAEALFSGTKSYSKRQIEEKLEFLGANYYAYADLDTAGISMSFINTDQDQVFPILKEVIQNAAFGPLEFEKRKKRLLLELVQAKEQPSLVLGSYFKKFIFGKHGYGNPIYGTRAAVKKIRSTEAKAFYNAHYRPEGSALVIVGDFQIGPMKEKVLESFAGWRGKENSPLPQEQTPLPVFAKSRVLLVNKSDATETQFAFGGLGIPRNHHDYVAVQVVNAILGGRFTSWLNDALRVDAGLTYRASSYFDTFKTSGTFAISSFTRTESTAAALDLAHDVLYRLHIQGVDEETLSAAKKYLIGQFPPLYETPGSLASLLAAMFVYDFDASFVNNFQKNVEDVTVEKARGVIAEHFPKGNLQFVLIGKAVAIRDQVKKYGELSEKDIKSDGF